MKDNKKETGVEYAAQLVSLPEPLHTRPKAYAHDEIPKLFGVMTAEERVRYLFFLHTACREQKVQYATTIKQEKYHLRKPTEVTCATSPVCEKHHPHRLRKTCATRWLRNGVNLMDIKTWLGHKSFETT